MVDIFKMSYVGTPSQVMEEIEYQVEMSKYNLMQVHLFACKYCMDTGFIIKTEWTNENDSYDVQGICPDCN